jgi:hypothetical protein
MPPDYAKPPKNKIEIACLQPLLQSFPKTNHPSSCAKNYAG